ncbi:MAG: EamA family transporter [Alphaproteobacteria bacterium]|jgi:drug/metabolite transporter (DMT)-like permease|nr:EamA family transporter [Alphaproteobacteria bacterium]
MSSSSPIQPVNKVMSPFEWGLLLTLSLLWGGSFFFVGVAVKELPTFTIVVCRVFFAALTLWAVMKAMGLKMPTSRRVWGAFFVMGFLNNAVPFSLIVWGQGHIASGLAAIINATTPLFTVIVAHSLTTDEKMTGTRLAGVIVGLVGVAFMIGLDVLQSLGVNVLAQIAILAASLSYAFAGVFGRRFRDLGVSPMAAATGQVTASSIMLAPIMLIVDTPWTLPVPSMATIGALAGIALLSTALAYTLYFRILATAGATNLLLVTLLVPVSAILLGVLVLGEVLEPKHFIGMAMIGVGLAAIDGRPIRAIRALFA